MHFLRITRRLIILLGAGLFLAGCNPATKGWSSSKGGSVSFGRLSAVQKDCNYPAARRRAINLLEAANNKRRNERRAAAIMQSAEKCMKKHGFRYKRQAYSIGNLRSN